MAAKQMMAAAAFFGVALFLSIAFVTYDGTSLAHEAGPAANLAGSVGVFLAEQILRTFGAGSFALAFFCLFVGYSVLTSRAIRVPIVKCCGALLTTLVLATGLQAIFPEAGYARSVFLLGGLLGDHAASLLMEWFGGLGTGLILLLLGWAGVVLATDTFIVEFARGLWVTTRDLVVGLRRPAIAFAGVLSGVRTAAGGVLTRGGRATDSDETRPARSRRLRRQEVVREKVTATTLADEVESTLRDLEATLEEAEAAAASEAEDEAEDVDELEYEVAADLADEAEDADDEPADDEDDLWSQIVEEEDDPEDEDDGHEGSEEDEDEEDEVELDDEADEGEDEDAEAEDEDESTELEVRRTPPVIRAGRGAADGDGIEILRLSRAKHLEGREMYPLPPLTLLDTPEPTDEGERDVEIRRKARKLEDTLETFGIQARVVEISQGPTITIYEIELAAGTKVKRITSLPDDISMALKAKTIRIVAPIPGKSTVGIEVPNDRQETVRIKELLLCDLFAKKTFEIPLFLGKDAAGHPLIEDLTLMPHLLIAGQTGAGKSVCLNAIIASLLLTKYPDEIRLILIDPKMVELQIFRNVPHLLTPVVTDMKKAPKILEWAVNEMERRYELLAAASVRDIRSFNDLGPEEARERLEEHFTLEELEEIDTFLPYVVVVVDELADLMMTSAKEIETSICRLAQKSRAVGIHVILATQRPSVDVITGLIKSNMPSRISFRVASKIDSRTILDQMGAERLLGRGDMLFTAPRAGGTIRCQSAYLSDKEIRNLVRYIKDVAQPQYSHELTQVSTSGGSGGNDASPSDRDPLYDDAVRAVLTSGRGSVSMLQRKLEVGYTRAARLVDFMAEDGVVGAFKGSKAREVLLTLEEWEERQAAKT